MFHGLMNNPVFMTLRDHQNITILQSKKINFYTFEISEPYPILIFHI